MLYDQWYANAYNTLFTTGPMFALALYDIDIDYRYQETNKTSEGETKEEILERPLVKQYYHYLYYITQNNKYFSYWIFQVEVISCFIEALWVTLVPLYAMDDNIMNSDGQVCDMWGASIAIFTGVIISANIVTLLRASSINWFLAWSIIQTSVGPYYLFLVLYDMLDQNDSQWSVFFLWNVQSYHLASFNIIVVITLCEFTKMTFALEIWPVT